MAEQLRVLLVEDSADDALLILRQLRKGDFDVISTRVDTPAALTEALASQPWDIVLSDYTMPHFNGLAALRLVRQSHPDLPFVLVSGAVGEEAAAEVMRSGAGDVILKDKLTRLLPAVQRELREAETFRQRLQAEKALHASEQRFRALIDQAGDAYYLSDTDGRLLEVNEYACQSLGYTRDELLAMTVSDVDPEAQGARHQETIWENLTPGDPITLETTHRRKDGTTFPVEVRAVLVELEGQQYVQGLARDITARRQAEAENARLEARLRQAHKMEAIGTLAGGIAHDFNNILTAILGYTDLLREDLPLGSEARAKLEEVAKASNRAKELVKHILAFSRSQTYNQEPLLITLLVKEVVKLLRASIPTTIEIRQRLAPNCPMIMADPTQIHQVLVNLCTNAAQALEQTGGVIELTLDKTEITASGTGRRLGLAAGHYLCLSVADNGPGIAPEAMEHIFEPYFTTKAFGKGTGMGLAVVHGIVKNCGGAIEVVSHLGQGATFHLYFPAIVAEPVPEAKEVALPPTGTERILFVDDEEALVQLGKAMFASLGYQVTAMANSQEALELFRKMPAAFDLVITDQAMPKIAGLELARAVMAIRPDIPVVLYTGYSAVVDEDKAKAAGIRAFVQKPLDRNEFARMVRRILDGA